MSNPSNRSIRVIKELSAQHGLSLEGLKLGDRDVRIHTLYAGGAHVLRLANLVNISFVQCGAAGSWFAILPADNLMKLLETESLFEKSGKERN
jgi:hypothetical protein